MSMILNGGIDWKTAVRKSKHYLAVGQARIYLDSNAADYPWALVTDCEEGGSHRLEIYTSVRFNAMHSSGLEFHWCFDIESRDANGKGDYHIDIAGCRRILHKLPPPARKKFGDYLKKCATAVRKKAEEWQEIADKQFATARDLEASTGN